MVDQLIASTSGVVRQNRLNASEKVNSAHRLSGISSENSTSNHPTVFGFFIPTKHFGIPVQG